MAVRRRRGRRRSGSPPRRRPEPRPRRRRSRGAARAAAAPRSLRLAGSPSAPLATTIGMAPTVGDGAQLATGREATAAAAAQAAALDHGDELGALGASTELGERAVARDVVVRDRAVARRAGAGDRRARRCSSLAPTVVAAGLELDRRGRRARRRPSRRVAGRAGVKSMLTRHDAPPGPGMSATTCDEPRPTIGTSVRVGAVGQRDRARAHRDAAVGEGRAGELDVDAAARAVRTACR